MEFKLPKEYESFATLGHELLSHYRKYGLPGAECTSIESSFGDLCIQIMRARGFSVQLTILNVVEEMYLYSYSPEGVILLHFLLKGEIHFFVRDLGERRLREGSYHLFFMPGKKQYRSRFDKGRYFLFHIELSAELLGLLANYHSELVDVLQRAGTQSIQGKQQHAAIITPRVKMLIKEMFECPADEPERHIYLETRVMELLLLYLREHPDEKGPVTIPRKHLEDMKSYILSHLDEPHSYVTLARRFNCNPTSLKRQLNNKLGQPLRPFLFHARMQAGMDLIKHSPMPFGAIAVQLGYRDFSSFCRAFKQHFGFSPTHFRKL